MIILGINCFGHDSAASILIDGEIVFACEEERLSRKKHSGAVPIQSIRIGLQKTGLKWNEINHITYSWNPKITYLSMPKFGLRFAHKVPTLLREKKNFSMEENLGMLNYLQEIKKLPKILDSEFGEGKYKFHWLEHHLTHGASAFYPSGFENAAILTIDGAGEWSTMTFQEGKANEIKKIFSVNTPHSMGAVYQAISRHLGFKFLEGPGKLMGLASYGNRDTVEYEKVKRIIHLEKDGGFKIDMSYFSYHYSRRMPVTPRFVEDFGPSVLEPGNWNQSELDLAAAIQRRTEDVFMNAAHSLRDRTKSENLVLAGGVALNSVANGKIAESGLFKEVFIQPAAGDSGTSAGGPLYLYHHKLGFKNPRKWSSSFLGPSYSEIDYKNELDIRSINYNVLSDADLYRNAAKNIVDGKIVAWFQDSLEFGPRALGNRSFLASPFISEMKDILNRRVKFREDFRPFAAAILEEDAHKYLTHTEKNPYMLMVFSVKKAMQQIIPAITHVDGTVRIQTVSEDDNPKLYKLLIAIREITGHGIVLNTSFNIKGEPIVCSPHDALESFAGADVDVLYLGSYEVKK
jgi:carbamoyltransferase